MTLLHSTNGKRMYQKSRNDGKQSKDKPAHIWTDPQAAYPYPWLNNDTNACIFNVVLAVFIFGHIF